MEPLSDLLATSQRQALEFFFGGDHVRPTGEDIVLESQITVTGRPLVVERHPGALLETEGTGIVLRLPGEDPEQGRLSGAISPGKRHAIPSHELEGHLGKERVPAEVDSYRCCCNHCHKPIAGYLSANE